MATINRGPVSVAYTIDGGAPLITWHKPGTRTNGGLYLDGGSIVGGGVSGTGYFKAGAFLYVNSSSGLDVHRRLATHTRANATGYAAAKKRLIGWALDDGVAATGTPIPILACHPNTIFYGNVGSTTSSATAITADTMLGDAFGASTNSSKCYVNVTASVTSSLFKIIGFHPEDTLGDTYGRVLFKMCSSVGLWQN